MTTDQRRILALLRDAGGSLPWPAAQAALDMPTPGMKRAVEGLLRRDALALDSPPGWATEPVLRVLEAPVSPLAAAGRARARQGRPEAP